MANSEKLVKDYNILKEIINTLEAEKTLMNDVELHGLKQNMVKIEEEIGNLSQIEETVVTYVYNDGEIVELSEELAKINGQNLSNQQIKKAKRKFDSAVNNKILGLRHIIEDKYKTFIKSNCRHCYGTGTIGYNGNNYEMPYPKLCRCLLKKTRNDELILLNHALNDEEDDFESFISNIKAKQSV